MFTVYETPGALRFNNLHAMGKSTIHMFSVKKGFYLLQIIHCIYKHHAVHFALKNPGLHNVLIRALKTLITKQG